MTVTAPECPPGWRTAPLWSIARRTDRRGHPDAELLSVYRDHGVIPKSSRDDNFNKPSEDLSAYRFVRPGDLVLNKMKTWQGSLAVSQFEGIVSPAYYVCSLSAQVHPRYIHYLLRSQPYIALYAALSKGIRPNQWDLPYDELRNVSVLLPPLDVRRRIADFLDDQVARIDQLVGLRAKQSALVGEVFQARIDNLYRAESNPPLRSLLAQDPCYGVLVPEFTEATDGVPLIRINNLLRPSAEVDRMPRIAARQSWEYRRTVVRPGDVLLSVVGSLDKAAIVPPEWSGANVNRPVARLVPRKGILPGP